MGGLTIRDVKVGDRVQLIAPFRCNGDTLMTDERIDAELRADMGGEDPVGDVTDVLTSTVRVKWKKANGYTVSYLVNPDVLSREGDEPTAEEIAELFRLKPPCPTCGCVTNGNH